MYEDDYFFATFAGEFYYQTRVSAVDMMDAIRFEWEAVVDNGCMPVLRAKLLSTKGCLRVQREAREAGADYMATNGCCKTCDRQTTTGCRHVRVDGADIDVMN